MKGSSTMGVILFLILPLMACETPATAEGEREIAHAIESAESLQATEESESAEEPEVEEISEVGSQESSGVGVAIFDPNALQGCAGPEQRECYLQVVAAVTEAEHCIVYFSQDVDAALPLHVILDREGGVEEFCADFVTHASNLGEEGRIATFLLVLGLKTVGFDHCQDHSQYTTALRLFDEAKGRDQDVLSILTDEKLQGHGITGPLYLHVLQKSLDLETWEGLEDALISSRFYAPFGGTSDGRDATLRFYDDGTFTIHDERPVMAGISSTGEVTNGEWALVSTDGETPQLQIGDLLYELHFDSDFFAFVLRSDDGEQFSDIAQSDCGP